MSVFYINKNNIVKGDRIPSLKIERNPQEDLARTEERFKAYKQKKDALPDDNKRLFNRRPGRGAGGFGSGWAECLSGREEGGAWRDTGGTGTIWKDNKRAQAGEPFQDAGKEEEAVDQSAMYNYPA